MEGSTQLRDPPFEIQGSRHQTSKTGVSVAPQKRLVSFQGSMHKRQTSKTMFAFSVDLERCEWALKKVQLFMQDPLKS